MGKTQLFRNTYLFAGLVIITFLLIAFTNLHILTPEFYERSGEPGLGGDSDERDHSNPAQADHPFRAKLTT